MLVREFLNREKHGFINKQSALPDWTPLWEYDVAYGLSEKTFPAAALSRFVVSLIRFQVPPALLERMFF